MQRTKILAQGDDPPPDHLYKFHSMQGGRKEWLRQLIQEGIFYFSRPADFNDPFDTLPILTIPRTKVAKERWLARIARQNASLIPNQSPNKVAREMTRTAPEVLQTLFQGAADKNAQTIGVLCLTARPEQVLMWSHYAASHTGVCLRLVTQRGHPPGSFAWRVRYQTHRPKLEGAQYRNPQRLLDALITKADFWAYEEEWRAMAPDLQFGAHTFDPAVIDGVIFGVKTTADDRALISGWAKEMSHTIEFLDAVPSTQDYRLEIVSTGSNRSAD